VTEEERPVDVGSPKQRAVLGLLLLEGGRVVSTDQLIDALWGEHPPPAATTSLHAYISNLRRALEPGRKPRDAPTRLLTRAPGYALVADRADVDWFRFEDLLSEGRAQLAAGRAMDALATLSAAYEMSGAPPQLDIDDGGMWAEIRGRWATLRAAVRQELLGARLAVGDHRVAVPDLEEAVRMQWPGLRSPIATSGSPPWPAGRPVCRPNCAATGAKKGPMVSPSCSNAYQRRSPSWPASTPTIASSTMFSAS
jgi:DNA-binding SARP family transcriptional activator